MWGRLGKKLMEVITWLEKIGCEKACIDEGKEKPNKLNIIYLYDFFAMVLTFVFLLHEIINSFLWQYHGNYFLFCGT
jgi:hypothetical protein